LLFLNCPIQAKYGGGTGEPNDPYQINTAEDFMLLGESTGDYDKHFILTADIDLDPKLSGRRTFSRAIIAPDMDPGPEFPGPVFTGSFNGNGNTIKHLTINGYESHYLGLFGKIGSKSRIHDLRIENIRVSSSGSCMSGLVGYNRGYIRNCRVSGTLSGGTGDWCSRVGLLAGRNTGRISYCEANGSIITGSAERGSALGLLAGQNRGIIFHCTATGEIRGGRLFREAGGLIGRNYGSIANCRSNVNVSMNSKYGGTGKFGGFAGTNSGPICRSYATGNVSGGIYSKYLGGFVGLNTGIITGCYATGDVSGSRANHEVGGLVGNNSGYIIQSYARGAVTADGSAGGLVGENWLQGGLSQCYSNGRVNGMGEYYIPVGGLVGKQRGGNVSNCFWDIEASGMTTSDGGTGLKTFQMQECKTFITSGWDFVSESTNGIMDIWLMPKDNGYPLLSFLCDDFKLHKLEGSGTSMDPYRIATPDDLAAIRNYDGTACYELRDDIDLAGITWTTTVIPSFEGEFKGNGFTVSNLKLRGEGVLGLFGVLWGNAIVENLQVTDASIIAGASGATTGILAVENYGRIIGCRTSGRISKGNKARELKGFIGYNHGTITNCFPIVHDGPYSVIVTDPEEVRRFLKYEGIRFDQVWIPKKGDLEGLETVLEMYINRDTQITSRTWIDQEYIADNLRKYNREHSGFIRGGSKYIICSMILPIGSRGSFVAERKQFHGKAFTIVMDGGCSIVRVIFDAKSKTVISIECNGMT
jgi:hypothetical protein